MSRLGAFCEKLIEACWLAAIMMAPLFFNVYSSRVFEPDKISLVRSLALVMLAAWLALRAETARMSTGQNREKTSPGARLRQVAGRWSSENPLTLPVLGLVAVYLVSTLFSISPSVSLLGSYQRLQGLYTTLSYIVIFFLAVSTIRSKAQIDRAISVALVVSFPIAFFGIIQHYFLDPLPWLGDVTARVASNMGNSIFVGAYLILVVPLALGRLLEHLQRASAQANPRLVYGGALASFLALAAAWTLSFELGAKNLIERNFSGKLTPEMLAATQSNFNLAVGVTLVVVFAWWLAAFLSKKRAGTFLLIAVYTVLLAVQSLTLLFTQSRGPLLGILGGLFAFAVLYALVRRAHRAVLGLVGVAVAGILFLILFNLAAVTPLAPLRDLPYIGRLGRVFETEGGTGKVRVLIWQGALQLALPHGPLWSPTTGYDALNPVRPLIGYGPETMYVAYNAFYPPDLGHIESRNATPDRSHNETFDALVTTGLIGFIVENLVFLALFYFALKWLGFINTPRARNIFIALWYGGGVAAALILGAILGWHYIGVGLPAGMISGFFLYLVVFALIRERNHNTVPAQEKQDPTPGDVDSRTLLLIMLLAAIVGHFIEIHFGIAIASTRTYFWFLSALLVVVGTRRAEGLAPVSQAAEEKTTPAPTPAAAGSTSAQRRRARRTATKQPAAQAKPAGVPQLISTAPLIAFAFLGGIILSTMAFDYINTTNVGQNGVALDIVISSLTTKATTAGSQTSPAMLWLFLGTLGVMLAIAVSEWGREARLSPRDWLFSMALFTAIALAIFSSFVFYHVMLIGTTGAGTFDALISSVALFVVFMLVMTAVVALTLLIDVRLPVPLVARPTNWIIAPGLALIAALLLNATNVSIVQADMIYKQAAGLGGADVQTSIALYQRALEMQPSQDYYYLFLGAAYLDYAKQLSEVDKRDQVLKQAEQALLTARQINPLNTDHSANLARLHQSWAVLLTDPAAQANHFKQAIDYFGSAIRLSPNTVHLYDQAAQAELDYATFLTQHNDSAAVAEVTRTAQDTIAKSLKLDPTFCLTYAVSAAMQTDWSAEVRDALTALKYAPICGDIFGSQGSSLALQALSAAGDRAEAAGAGAQFAAQLQEAGRSNPTVETYTALLNYYSKAGQIAPALEATDAALALIPAGDPATRQKYQDFRKTLVDLQQAIDQAKATPNDPEAHRKLAQAWLARGQGALALPEYERVLALKPNDYDAARHVTLLLVQRNQLPDATRALSPTLTLAPTNDRAFWEKLAGVLGAAQGGQKEIARTNLDALTKTVDPKDNLALDALHALSANLQTKP